MLRPCHRLATVAGIIALACLVALPAAAQKDQSSKNLMSPEEALKLITTLEGQWEGLQLGDSKVTVEYETVARGTAVLEVIARGTEKEMATVYAIEDNELIANHYCLGGYRTQMRFNRERSTPDRLLFDYVNLANVDLQRAPKTIYVDGLTLQIPGGDVAKARTAGFAYGQDYAQGLDQLGPYTTNLMPAGSQKK